MIIKNAWNPFLSINRKLLGGIALGCLSFNVLVAQVARPSEKDILLEKSFIEAAAERVLGNYQEAVARYLEVLQKDNNNAPANYELSVLYALLKQPDQALARAARAAELAPQQPIYVQHYAVLLMAAGDSKKAVEWYEALLKLYPDRADLYYAWSDLCLQAKLYDSAVKTLDALQKRLGQQPEIALRRSTAYEQSGNAKKAGEELEKLAKTYNQVADFALLTAQFYQRQNQNDKAKQWYEQVLKLQPNNPEANLYLSASLLTVQKDTSKYLESLLLVFEKGNLSAADMQRSMQGLMPPAQARYAEPLLRLCQVFAAKHPSAAQAHFWQADLLFDAGQYAPAIEEYAQGLETDKGQMNVWLRYAEAHSRSGSIGTILPQLLDFVETYPNNPEPYVYAAEAHLQLKQYDKALDLLLAAQPVAGANLAWKPRLQTLLGQVYVRKNQMPQAEKLFKDNAAAFADNVYAQGGWAWWLCSQKRAEEAKAAADKALKIPGAQALPWLWECAGDAWLLSGNTAKAVELWGKASEKGNKSSALQQKIQTKQLAAD